MLRSGVPVDGLAGRKALAAHHAEERQRVQVRPHVDDVLCLGVEHARAHPALHWRGPPGPHLPPHRARRHHLQHHTDTDFEHALSLERDREGGGEEGGLAVTEFLREPVTLPVASLARMISELHNLQSIFPT